MGASVSADGDRRALSIVMEMTQTGQTPLRRTIRSPPRQSRQIAQNLRRRAPRFRIGRRALSIMTEMSRKGQTAGPCACQYKIDAKNPLPAPQAGGGRPATGRPPSRRSSRRQRRAGPLAGRGVRGVGGVMAHPAAVAVTHPAKVVAKDCRICMVCENVLGGEGRLPSFVVTVRGIIVVAG